MPLSLPYGAVIPPAAVCAWSARAIFRDGQIDLLPDRQASTAVDGTDPDAFHSWLSHTGMPAIRTLAQPLRGSDTTTVETNDGDFHIEASPKQSHGYLYIAAWQIGAPDTAAPADPKDAA